MLLAAKTMTLTAIALLTDPRLLAGVREEFDTPAVS
jgi:hypothetical protein